MKLTKKEIFNFIIMMLIFVEYLYLITFYSFVIRARLFLSRWPSYENPDPKLLHFDIHQEIVADSFTYSFISILFLLVFFIISLYFKIKIKQIYWLLYLLGICLIAYNLLLDPLFEWFSD